MSLTMKKTFPALLIAAFILLSLFPPARATAQAGATFFVGEVDSAAFPTVTFRLRAVDLNNQPLTSLNSASLSIYENGELMPGVVVTPHVDGPVNVIFVVDLGQLSNLSASSFGIANARQMMASLVTSGYFQDGVDRVMVLGRQNVNSDQTVTLLPATQTGADLTTWASTFQFPRSSNRTKGLLGVDDAINAMAQLAPQPGKETTAVIFITRFIEDPNAAVSITAAQNTVEAARQNNITLHVFQTDARQTNKDALQVLATGTNGQYAPLLSTTFATAVDAVYKIIDAQRAYYTVLYRSNLSASGQRLITINSTGLANEGMSGNYEVTVEAPALNLSEPPTDETIRREALLTADGSGYAFTTNSVEVVANVTWPDKHPREVTSAQLLINDKVEDTLTLAPGQNHFEFEWDLSDIDQAGLNSVHVAVKVVDELGLEATADNTYTIEVILPPTPSPEPTAVPGLTVPEQVPTWLGLVIAGVCALGAVAVVVIGIFAFLARPKVATSQPAVATPRVSAAPDIQNTLIGGAAFQNTVLATLTVLEGPKGMMGEPLRVTKATTIIGRNPQKSDITFYPDEESSVSRIHCTIQLDNKTFKLTDNGSSSGTRLNGRQIQPNDPVLLGEGFEIVLGDLAKRGIKLRFNLVTDQAQLRVAGTAEDHTHIVEKRKDDGDDNWERPQF